MAKTLICLVLTLVFSFLGFRSFMNNDYGPLKEWMAYYTEYKALQNALNEGNASKAEILDKLKAMYPERAKELEAKFKAKYGDLKDSAQDTQDSVQSSLNDTLNKIKEQSTASQEERQQSQSDNRRVDTPSRDTTSSQSATPSHHNDDSSTHTTSSHSGNSTSRNQ